MVVVWKLASFLAGFVAFVTLTPSLVRGFSFFMVSLQTSVCRVHDLFGKSLHK